MDENEILNLLKQNPGMAFISPDETQLYALIPDTDEMLCWTGDFSLMSAKRINHFIQDWLA